MEGHQKLKDSNDKVLKACEICNSNSMSIFQEIGRSEEPGVYGSVPIKICHCCGFKMLNPRFQDEYYKDYYKQLYRKVAFGLETPSNDYIEQQKVRGKGVLSFAAEQNISPGKMLDHGCASGFTMTSWIESQWECFGIDPHRPSVELGQRMGFNVKIASGEDVPFDDESFNLVLSLGSFEHSYNSHLTLREVRRILMPSGYIMIRWRKNELFGSPLEYYNHNHYRFFTPNSLAVLLYRYGFYKVASTDDDLEGWPSYSYLLVQKKDKLPTDEQFNEFLFQNKDDYEAEIEKIKAYRKDYFERAKIFVQIYDKYKGNQSLIMKFIEDESFKWSFLGGKKQETLHRSLMEAEKYVRAYNINEVF